MADKETIFIGIRAGTSDLKNDLNVADSSIKKFSQNVKESLNFRNIAETALGFGIANAAQKGVEALIDFSKEAVGAAIASEVAFQQLNLRLGETARIMLKDLRNASKSMVSDLNLVKSANRALALGINENQIPQLMEVATARAKIFGSTTTQAFEDITLGIGRGSKLILDNLGIIVDLDKTYKQYADTQGIVGRALSETEKKQALVNAVLKESEGLLLAQLFLQDTTSEKLQRLTTGWENFKTAIGTAIIDLWDLITAQTAWNDIQRNTLEISIGLEDVDQLYQDIGTTIVGFNEELKQSNESAQALLNSMLNLGDVIFQGERKGTLAIAQMKEEIRATQLAMAKLPEGADKTELETLLENQRNQLQILRLEQEQYANEREIQQTQNAVNLENIGALQVINSTGEQTSFEVFSTMQAQKLIEYQQEINKQTEIKSKQDLLIETINKSGLIMDEVTKKKLGLLKQEQDSVDVSISKYQQLIDTISKAATAKTEYEKAQAEKSFIEKFTTGGKSMPTKPLKKKDFVVTPSGIIESSPQDFIFGLKNPNTLGGGITINIGTIQGIDADSIAIALQERLQNLINTA